MRPIQRVLRILLAAEMAHPLMTIFLAALLAVFAVLYTVKNLQFQAGRKDLITPDRHLAELFKKGSELPDLDSFIVVIENDDTARSLDFLRALAPTLEADQKHFTEVFYRVDPDQFKDWALLFLSEEDLATLRDNLSDHQDFIRSIERSPDLTNFFGRLNQDMTSKMVGKLFTGFLEDEPTDREKKPLKLDFVINVLESMKRWLDGDRAYTSPWASFFSENSKVSSHEGYFWSGEHKYLLVFITPREENQGFTKSRDALVALRETIAKVKMDFPDIRVGVTGRDALNMDEMGGAFRDMSVATIISLVALTLLLIIFWRGLRHPVIQIVVLLIALCWTFGLTTLFIGHLNILSVTFAPLLLGLGIDYGVHWFSRYQEEQRYCGGSKREIVRKTTLELGPSIALAGITAALSFFPLVLTGFKGLAELGIITAIGLLMATLATLGVLPSITLLFDRSDPVRKCAAPGAKPLFRMNGVRSVFLLAPALIALALALEKTRDVNFDLNMLRLQSNKAESVIWERHLIEDTKRSSLYAKVYATSIEEVRNKTAALEALPTVSEVKSVEDLLPKKQEAKIDFLRTMIPLVPEHGLRKDQPQPIDIRTLDNILGRISFKMLESDDVKEGLDETQQRQMERVRELARSVRQDLRALEKPQDTSALESFQEALLGDLNDKLITLRAQMSPSPMRLKEIPLPLLKRFVGKEDNLYLLMVFPTQNIWDPGPLGRFVGDIRSVDPDVTGNPVTLYDFTRAFREASFQAVEYALVFVVLLLGVTFRDLGSALWAMLPLGVGAAWTLGLMGRLGVSLNLANVLFLPLVVGAGIEYGIIILQRWAEDGRNPRDASLPWSTIKGVVLAGLTTTVGFGSLIIADHQGIHSLGMLAMFGSLSTLGAAVLVLPSLKQVWLSIPRPQSLTEAFRLRRAK